MPDPIRPVLSQAPVAVARPSAARRAWAKVTGRKIVGEIDFWVNNSGRVEKKHAVVYEGETVHDVIKRVFRVETREHELGVIYDRIGSLRSQYTHINIVDPLTGERSVAAVQNGNEIMYINPPNMAVTNGRHMVIEITESFEHADLPNGSMSRINGVFSEFMQYPLEMRASAIGLAAAFETMKAYRALPPHLFQPFWLAHSHKNDAMRENIRRMVSEAVIKRMLGRGVDLSVSSEFMREKTGAASRNSIGISVQFEVPETGFHTAFSNARPIAESQFPSSGFHAGIGAAEGGQSIEAGKAENSGKGNGSSGQGRADFGAGKSSKTGKAGGFGLQGDEESSDSDSGRTGRGGKYKSIPLSSLTDFKAVIFDLDGVVVDSESAHLRSFNELLAMFGVKITEKMWRENYTGVGSLAILKDVFAKNGIKEDVRPWMAKRAEIYHDVIVKNGLKEISGFSQFFKLLEQNGIKVAVASGGHKPHILASMMSIGMPRVEFVGLEDVKNAKPAPETFLLAAAKLGVSPSQCVVFEDSFAGMKAASSAGMPCIALSTTLPASAIKGKAALIVNNFASPALRREIKKLIAKNGGKKTEKKESAKTPGWLYPVKRKANAGKGAKPRAKSAKRRKGKKAGKKRKAVKASNKAGKKAKANARRPKKQKRSRFR